MSDRGRKTKLQDNQHNCNRTINFQQSPWCVEYIPIRQYETQYKQNTLNKPGWTGETVIFLSCNWQHITQIQTNAIDVYSIPDEMLQEFLSSVAVVVVVAGQETWLSGVVAVVLESQPSRQQHWMDVEKHSRCPDLKLVAAGNAVWPKKAEKWNNRIKLNFLQKAFR